MNWSGLIFNSAKIFLGLFFIATSCLAQQNDFKNRKLINILNEDTSYTNKKSEIIKFFAHTQPGSWGKFVKGVDRDLVTRKKIIAFTFDACGGKHGDGYDKELINYLQKKNIPATLFVSGKWIDENFSTFIELSKDTLFEIENHGFNHRPCSIDGEVAYGLKGTQNIADAYDEIEANERKIELLTGQRPKFYRSATTYINEASVRIANQLNITVISFDVLGGDAVPNAPVETIVNTVVNNIKPGAIVLLHFNHPEWNTYESLVKIIPKLTEKGYSFAKLKDYPIQGR